MMRLALIVLTPVLSLCAIACSEAESLSTLNSALKNKIDQTVTVQGMFEGYQASVCTFDPAVRASAITRSDWLVKNGPQCIYVSGGRPPGDAIDPGNLGRAIEVTGAVQADGNGLVYLRHQSSRFIP